MTPAEVEAKTHDLIERLRQSAAETAQAHHGRSEELMLAAADALAAKAAEIERMRDSVEGLNADLFEAVYVAYSRGAVEWARLNYPKWIKRIKLIDAADLARQALSAKAE